MTNGYYKVPDARCLITPEMIRREIQRRFDVDVYPAAGDEGLVVAFGERCFFVPACDLRLSLDEYAEMYLKD
jgi:hypothetical protein